LLYYFLGGSNIGDIRLFATANADVDPSTTPALPSAPVVICTDNDGDRYIVENNPNFASCGNVCGHNKNQSCLGYNDCNDNNSSIYPGAPEVCGNGIDESCSGADLACPICTSFTYSAWGICFSNNTQTRTVISKEPVDCQGGNPILSQACTYVPGSGGGGESTQSTESISTTSPPSSETSVNENGQSNSQADQTVDQTDKEYYETLTHLGGLDSQTAHKASYTEAETTHESNQFVPLDDTTLGLYLRITEQSSSEMVEQTKYAIARFIHFGTPTTLRLGAGERAGVINSYLSAFKKMPENTEEWQDVVKIANGRWPGKSSVQAENDANLHFQKIYKREANMENPNDNAAVTVIAYGLRPSLRNFDSEKNAIRIYKAIYGQDPKEAVDWDIVRAIAYSGAVR
jgi:hypothetical protein